jgi:hypothetical protein
MPDVPIEMDRLAGTTRRDTPYAAKQWSANSNDDEQDSVSKKAAAPAGVHYDEQEAANRLIPGRDPAVWYDLPEALRRIP